MREKESRRMETAMGRRTSEVETEAGARKDTIKVLSSLFKTSSLSYTEREDTVLSTLTTYWMPRQMTWPATVTWEVRDYLECLLFNVVSHDVVL